MKLSIIVLLFSLVLAASCNNQASPVSRHLTVKETFNWDSLKIDSSLITSIREQTDSTLTPFPANLEKILDKDIDTDVNRKNYPGLIFNAPNASSDGILTNLYDNFQKRGYTIFVLDESFGIQKKPDVIGVLKTVDKYAILRQVQTDGINAGIDNDSLLKVIKIFDDKYLLQLIGASVDWCEFKITREPEDWLVLAKEAYKVCPDIVEQGTGSVEKLAEEMKRTRRLYFWWD